MNVNQKVGLAGRFKITATNSKGESRVLADWFDNLITDNGLNMPGSLTLAGILIYCRVGSGTTAPAFGDTALDLQVASATAAEAATLGTNSISPYYKWVRIRYRFDVGVATGNLSEVGIAPTALGNLFTRALIKDLSGTPTTITVLSDEVLDVVYEFRIYQTEADWTDTVTMDGDDYDVTIRARKITDTMFSNDPFVFGIFADANANAYNLGAITDEITPGGGGTGAMLTSSIAAYTNGNYYRDVTISTGLSGMNMGTNAGGTGIKVANFTGGVVTWQAKWEPPIPKDGTKILSLTFRFSWARYTIP